MAAFDSTLYQGLDCSLLHAHTVIWLGTAVPTAIGVASQPRRNGLYVPVPLVSRQIQRFLHTPAVVSTAVQEHGARSPLTGWRVHGTAVCG